MAAAVESPLTFFQEPIRAVFWDAVEASQVPFVLVPKVLNTVDVVAAFADKSQAVVHAPIMKLGHIQHIIRPKAVGINNAIGQDLFSNDGYQCRGFSIGNDGGVNFATTL